MAQGKKIFLLAAGGAVQRFRDQLGEQQEIMSALANCAMEIYAMESALRRAQKAASRGNSAAAAMSDAARAFIYDASDRLEKEARTALAATLEGDTKCPKSTRASIWPAAGSVYSKTFAWAPSVT